MSPELYLFFLNIFPCNRATLITIIYLSFLQDHPFFYTYKNSNDSALSKSMADQEQDENDQSSFKAVNLEKQSETHQEKSEYQSVTLATIIGAVIGALCVVCAVGILVWRKRKARNYYENLSD